MRPTQQVFVVIEREGRMIVRRAYVTTLVR